MDEKQKKILRISSRFMFGVYLILLIYFLFFAESMGRTYTERSYQYNLILFREIRRFLTYRETLGTAAVMLNLAGNIAAFVPFGFFLPVMNWKNRRFFKILLLTFEFSLLVELVQLLCKVGSFDVDDLLLNTVGGACGYVLFAILNKFRRKRNAKTSKNV